MFLDRQSTAHLAQDPRYQAALREYQQYGYRTTTYQPQNYVRNGNYPTRCANIAGFSSDAYIAITQAPDYFVWWYTAKSTGLGVAVGIIGFLIGRVSKR